jgi:hypothetical protein
MSREVSRVVAGVTDDRRRRDPELGDGVPFERQRRRHRRLARHRAQHVVTEPQPVPGVMARDVEGPERQRLQEAERG